MQRRSHTSDIEGEWMEGLACGPSDEPSEGIVVSKPTARLMMLVNAAVWGSGYTMLKHVQESMPTQWVMFFRMAAAVLLMGVVFFPPSARDPVASLRRPGTGPRTDVLAGFSVPAQRAGDHVPGPQQLFHRHVLRDGAVHRMGVHPQTAKLAASGRRARLRGRHWIGVAERWRRSRAYEYEFW